MKTMTSIMNWNSAFTRRGAVLCVGLLLTATALAGDTKDKRGQVSFSEYKFGKEAAMGGQMEVQLGKLASQKSSNPSIQQFGQRMVADHGKAGETLKGIAAKNGATLPDTLSSSAQREENHLNKLTGEDFDKEYVSMMVKDHKKDLKEFQHAAKNADNPELKQFAETTAQTIQEHLNLIQDIQKQMSSSKTAASQ